ncbi:SDR family NAD(P)-dependent oxidoreductase [Alkalilacustris brevis]|uniref:SDR family NAD(P)-dependent oxidoreductase n=1 Tax=Alkalilacustris brevis TaxID=2026338 RepID=UPI000E0D99AC|nr:SDR family oxidoreductase [Alkalilacustris brevis]
MQVKPLQGKTAFISGSGRNIGRAVAVRLAEMGCNIVINGARDRDACEETRRGVEQQGGAALIVMGDMADAATVDNIAKSALERFGAVDIVVNNAAIRPHKSFIETTEAEWHRVVDTGLTAAFKISRAFLPGMIQNGWGRIISMTGMKAMRGYYEGAAISASKHALWGLTKALSTEFAPKGVTVNAISPGQILTEGRDPDDPKKLATIPVGHMGTPEDVAAMVGFLASEDGRFVTGQMIGVNGGEST